MEMGCVLCEIQIELHYTDWPRSHCAVQSQIYVYAR